MVATLPALATLEPAIDAVFTMLKDRLPAALRAAEAGTPYLTLPPPQEYRTAFITEWRAVKAWPTLSAMSASLTPHDLTEQGVLSWRGSLDLDLFVKNTADADALERQLQRYGAVLAELLINYAPYANCPIDFDTLAIGPSEKVESTLHSRSITVVVDLLVYPS